MLYMQGCEVNMNVLELTKLNAQDVQTYEIELDLAEERHTISNDQWCDLMSRFLHTFGNLNETIKI